MSENNENKTSFELLPVLFRHNTWSNLRLIDACLTLNMDQLTYETPGTFGSIFGTIGHIVNAEEYYLYLLTGSRPDGPKADSGIPLSALRERAEKSGDRLLEVAINTPGKTAVQVGKGEDAELLPASILMLQAIHHATEHRTQITTIMGVLGIEPPEISGWQYFEDVIAPYQES